MIPNKREYYSPEMEVTQINPEGIILISGGKQDYNDGGILNWGS